MFFFGLFGLTILVLKAILPYIAVNIYIEYYFFFFENNFSDMNISMTSIIRNTKIYINSGVYMKVKENESHFI